MKQTVTGVFIYLLTAMLLAGQSLSSVSGVVTDPSGAMIPGARITLENLGTGATRDTVSDAAGRYVIPQVQPGPTSSWPRRAGLRR
jgi:hypothetical protein